MSDETQPIDTGAEVSIPEGEVTHEQLVKILEDSRAAEPKGDEPAVVEPPKVVEPPAEKVSARILASRKAEMRQAEERRALAAERESVAAERKAAAEAKAQADAFAAAKMSPSKALELLGMSPKEFLESLATEHEPEAVAKRAMVGTQTEVQKLAAELAAIKAEREQERQALRHRETQEITTREGDAFAEFVAAQAEKFPALVETWTPDQFVREALTCLEEPVAKTRDGRVVTRLDWFQQEQGRIPSNEEIAEFLEQRAQPAFQKRSAWRERIGKSAPVPSQGVSAIQGQPVMAAKPRTLTNGASATNASAPKPWSQADADAESIRIIEQLNASRQST